MKGLSIKIADDLKMKFDLALITHNMRLNKNGNSELTKQDIVTHLIERFTNAILEENPHMDTYYNQRCQTIVDNIMNEKRNTN